MAKGYEENSPMKDAQGFLRAKKILEVIQAGQTKRDRLLMQTLWATGARVSEIVGKKICEKCGQPAHHDADQEDPPQCTCENPEYIHENPLTRERIDEKSNRLVLYTLKRSSDPPKRLVSVPESLVKKLLEYSEGKDDDERIFPITQQRVYQIVREAGERAGVEKVGDKPMHPHVFRHSHAVAYIQGENRLEALRRLQQRYKHASIDITSHYLQFAIDEEEKEKIEETFDIE